ncbi:hypothetical protein MKX01_017176 [Papaver californicum]|nr:hypothetical protein MKX01_017176 [Papaver californicum]
MSASDSPKVTWTIKEDQILETALFMHDENSRNRWEKIANVLCVNLIVNFHGIP